MKAPYYQDDHVTIYHGDCLEILPSVDRADVLMTDPPYSLSGSLDHHKRKGKGTRRLDFFEGDRDWQGMTSMVVDAVSVASTRHGICSAYVWCGHRQFGHIVGMFEAAQWSTRPLVWRKACPVPAPPGVGWDSAVELCVYAFRPGRKWTPPTGTKCPNVIDADSYRHGQPGKVSHPTQKPMQTATTPLRWSSDPGDTVLDPFAGSGTTLRAAKDLGRKAIGIEIDERYCEIAAERCAQEVLDFGDTP
ncbi:MAG: site-specific DNA-methyltransferase [Actinomycetia bacterium]|nr:site-specific DNA-methyltransferase [Actinomycetes bacterium]